MRYRTTGKSVYSVKYHVIWCPKYRRRLLGGRVEARLKQLIGEIADCGGEVIKLEPSPTTCIGSWRSRRRCRCRG